MGAGSSKTPDDDDFAFHGKDLDFGDDDFGAFDGKNFGKEGKLDGVQFAADSGRELFPEWTLGSGMFP